LRPETAAVKQEGIQQVFQRDPRAGDHEMSSWYFLLVAESEGLDTVEGSAPSETEKETAHGVVARNVEALATSGSFAPSIGKRRKTQDDGDTPGSAGTLAVNHSGYAVLRKEQQERRSKPREGR
jgi:hypothetical protein